MPRYKARTDGGEVEAAGAVGGRRSGAAVEVPTEEVGRGSDPPQSGAVTLPVSAKK